MWKALVLLGALLGTTTAQPAVGSPIYEYVQRPDPNYGYTEVSVYPGQGITTYVLNMTSLAWFDDTWSDHPIWFHYVSVIIPDTINPDYTEHAFLYVSYGDWDDDPPDDDSRHVWEAGVYANRTGMITATIRQIPNQPILFNDTVMYRWEDEIIAWTWAYYMESGGTANPEVLLRFPMVKAVSRAMDTMASFAQEQLGSGINLDKFMIAGESKRGWTTWLMPAVDPRVVAMSPVVLSCLNLNENMHHYWQSMGNWTFAFAPYLAERIPEWMDTPEMTLMQEQVDPYFYRDTMNLPKLMVSGAADEFFMLDDYDYFFDDLPGEKYIWLLENSGHGMSDSPLYDAYWRMLETFYVAVIQNRPRPTFTWSRGTNMTTGSGHIEVKTTEPVNSVVAWMADTPDVVAPRRDFRKEMLDRDGLSIIETGIVWNEYPAEDLGNDKWRVEFSKPDSGYRAFYMKLNFPYPEEGRDFTFTSKAHILSYDPADEFPFEDCTGEGCMGNLV